MEGLKIQASGSITTKKCNTSITKTGSFDFCLFLQINLRGHSIQRGGHLNNINVCDVQGFLIYIIYFLWYRFFFFLGGGGIIYSNAAESA